MGINAERINPSMEESVFSVSERNEIRDEVLRIANQDARVVAGAVIGSLARGNGDRWSDLDLTFGVVDEIPVESVLTDWTQHLIDRFDAVVLFDLWSEASLYRVFLMPGCLQFDLSFTPASAFGAVGSKFQLLFGQAVERPFYAPKPAHEMFGYAVHHAVRARFCIERGRVWQAEYWISGVRDLGLALACRRRGLASSNGRGYDDLPNEVREVFVGSLVHLLEPSELLRALASAIDGLLGEADEVKDLAKKVEPQLRLLTSQIC